MFGIEQGLLKHKAQSHGEKSRVHRKGSVNAAGILI